MSIIDILAQDDTEAGTFTVDITKDSVPITWTDTDLITLKTAENKYKFTYKDNFEILSVGIKLYLGFEYYESDYAGFKIPRLLLKIQNDTGSGYDWKDLDNPKILFMPFENYEYSIGIKADIPDDITGTFNLGAILAYTDVSMFNVDSKFDGLTFHCSIFMKILHTIPLL